MKTLSLLKKQNRLGLQKGELEVTWKISNDLSVRIEEGSVRPNRHYLHKNSNLSENKEFMRKNM